MLGNAHTAPTSISSLLLQFYPSDIWKRICRNVAGKCNILAFFNENRVIHTWHGCRNWEYTHTCHRSLEINNKLTINKKTLHFKSSAITSENCTFKSQTLIYYTNISDCCALLNSVIDYALRKRLSEASTLANPLANTQLSFVTMKSKHPS